MAFKRWVIPFLWLHLAACQISLCILCVSCLVLSCKIQKLLDTTSHSDARQSDKTLCEACWGASAKLTCFCLLHSAITYLAAVAFVENKYLLSRTTFERTKCRHKTCSFWTKTNFSLAGKGLWKLMLSRPKRERECILHPWGQSQSSTPEQYHLGERGLS